MENPIPTTAPPPPNFNIVGQKKVPNVYPSTAASYRLAIIGEAPGSEEESYGQPFCGPSGNELNRHLSSVGISRSACFVGNVCQHRPPGNEIGEWLPTKLRPQDSRVTEGFEELKLQLADFKPNAILALGNTPLQFLTGRTGIFNYRGSILSSTYGKVIPSIHPAFVLREYKWWPLLRFDSRRALEESQSSSLNLPQRHLDLNISANEICNRLDNWPAGLLCSLDIEGGLDAWPCIGITGAINNGFIISWGRHSEVEQARIAVSLSRLFYNNNIPKCLQNSLYDKFVLAYGYGMMIRNVREDTMDKQGCIYSELKKSLAMIASIWTREPFYKNEEMYSGTQEGLYRGCIKDACVTLESCLNMDNSLSPRERQYYTFSVALKNPLLFMEMKGFNYDHELKEKKKKEVQEELDACAFRLSSQVLPIQWNKLELSSNLRGKGGSLSDKRLPKVLYEQKGYPVQYKGRGPDKKVTCNVDALLKLCKGREHDNFLQDILRHRKLESLRETLAWKTDPDGRIRCSYNQFSKATEGDEEGGGSTETQRLRCSGSITGSGGNLQTVTKKLRSLYIPDEGYDLFQADLAGADGWTVAARCLSFGDPTMWDDYKFGLKPARIIALMYMGIDVSKLSRQQLKVACKEIDDEGWLYFACKRVQHSTNYGVTERTGADQVMTDSYKFLGYPIYIEPATFAALQALYLARYPGVFAWHSWAKDQVFNNHNLTSASGHTRIFFGRRQSWSQKHRGMVADHETWKEFLADEPQENTSYANNLATLRLWLDTENRGRRIRGLTEEIHRVVESEGITSVVEQRADCIKEELQSLIIQPLHTVHDANIGQWPKIVRNWARVKVNSYYQNELEIANQLVTIPFDGAYGPNWSMHQLTCAWHRNEKCDCDLPSRSI